LCNLYVPPSSSEAAQAQVTSAARVKQFKKINVSKCFGIYEAMLRLINFRSHYEDTVSQSFSTKNAKLSPYRVSEGSLYLQQRAVHSRQLLPA
jgi:hypothetical protein